MTDRKITDKRRAAAVRWATQQASKYGLNEDQEAQLIERAIEIAERYRRFNDGYKCNTLIVREAQKLADQDWSNVCFFNLGGHVVLFDSGPTTPPEAA